MVGLISDTHGLLRPDVSVVFAGVDLIVHAGDVGGIAREREFRCRPSQLVAMAHVDGDAVDGDGPFARQRRVVRIVDVAVDRLDARDR